LRVTATHERGFRDHCILSLALATGLREHEILALDVGDIYTPLGHCKQRVALRVFKRSNRRRDDQTVVLCDRVRYKLEKFFRYKRLGGESTGPDEPVFVSRQGNRLSARRVRDAFAKWQRLAGFERHLNFHALRHTACTNIYRRDKDPRKVAMFARHASLLSTMRYIHCSDEELLQAVQDIPC
jgi:site-specific recombinase XerD